MRKTIDIFHRVEEGFLAFLLAGMVVITFTQVVARYVFNSGAIWALELTTYCFAWLVILGISYGIRIHGHIGVDAFVKLFPAGGQRFFSLISIVAGIAYAALLLYGSWDHVIEILFMMEIESEDLKVPQWIPMSVLLIGMSMIIIRLLFMAWRIIVQGNVETMLADEGRDAIEHFQADDSDNDNGSAGPRS